MREAVDKPEKPVLSQGARGMMRLRSLLTLAAFALGGLVALWHPLVGFGLICCCLVTYLRPDTSK